MYREAVGRLRAVMERVGIEVGPVPSGLGLPELTEKEKEEAAQARRKRQTNGSVRPEEEGRTLRGIVSWMVRLGRFRGADFIRILSILSTTLTSLG